MLWDYNKNYSQLMTEDSNILLGVLQFHRSMTDYYTATLEKKIGEVYIKDESDRMGTGSFKILGVSYAIYKLYEKMCHSNNFNGLKDYFDKRKTTFVTASDGNFGIAMSYFCKLLHQECRVFIPQTTPEYYVNKMKINKAEINFVDGNYDECVEKANEYNGKENVSVILDTSKEGMHMSDIAENVINGYTTLFAEKGNQYYDYIFVPAGVGGVAAAAVKYNRCIGNSACKIICVEPINYNSLQKSLINGYLTQIKGSNTLMNGLKCGCPSEAAWQYIQSGVYGSISISDSECIIGKEELERKGINTGYTGASAYAGYKAFCHEEIEDLKGKKILILNTEYSE
ncbi:PLP-dependent lyase/thiolase [Gallintestinimicrobium propionicum]|uniref:PLP-dependent lyase/thiolase n=1 Tax=Gallintestinimicrobium propionicum TaxID=2981770 RepID=A0AAE3DNG3_9FIRM|nr:PLP-dependent lyase/thiolase [Gallintestinimicrobium propionicum]MCC2168662.1 PLP-dependent lyase/thiolase [Gallintestinimicrobium propionicum]